jgi:hypothetical protein
MWWFNKENPNTIFGDIRRETITVTDRSNGKADGVRTISINPDIELDFRCLPFEDNTFNLVAFDLPHLIRAGAKSWLASKYDRLQKVGKMILREDFQNVGEC